MTTFAPTRSVTDLETIMELALYQHSALFTKSLSRPLTAQEDDLLMALENVVNQISLNLYGA